MESIQGRRDKSGAPKRRWSAILGMFLLVVGAASPAVAGEGGATGEVVFQDADVTIVNDGDWTRWVYADSIAESTTRVDHGVRELDGGCRYSVVGSPSAPPLGSVWFEREIARSHKECVSIIELGIVAAMPDELAAVEMTGGAATESSGSKTRFLKVYYEDPIFIDVTSVRSNVSFSYNGSCVTDSWSHTGEFGHFAGWTRTYADVDATRSCSYATTDSEGHFRNDIFCPGSGNTTWNKYYSVKIYGLPDGGYTYSYNTVNYGGCSSLLSRHVRSG